MGRKKKVVDNTINKSIPLANEFDILPSDVIQRENFGGFELVKTKKGIMFKNYTGYHVWTTQYAVGIDGKAHEYSLYSALNELFNLKKLSEEEPDGIVVEGVTNKDIFESECIVVQANLTKPVTVFTDPNLALTSAKEYMDWLNSKQKDLSESMSNLKEEDEKANAEFKAKQENMEVVKTLLDGKD